MSTIAFDQFALTRIADFARSLSRLHHQALRQVVDDDQIEFEISDGVRVRQMRQMISGVRTKGEPAKEKADKADKVEKIEKIEKAEKVDAGKDETSAG